MRNRQAIQPDCYNCIQIFLLVRPYLKKKTKTATYVEIGGQLVGVSSFLPLCGSGDQIQVGPGSGGTHL